MRLNFTLFLLLGCSFLSHSQKLTGIWRGTFVERGPFDPAIGQFTEDRYKYEIQINQLDDKTIEGVTYSYKTTIFYGKSSFHGLYTHQTKNVLIKEIKMLELKVSNNSIPCLMTCYLDYSKEGTKEILSGNFTSQSSTSPKGCGDGTIYLERVKESEFKKEAFLNKKTTDEPANSNIKNNGGINAKPNSGKAADSNNTNLHKQAVKPGAEGFIVKKDPDPDKQNTQPPVLINPPAVAAPKKQESKPAEVPKVLKERENKLANTIILDEQDVRIDYYDNGEIDNDTITVYHDNKMVINHGRLSDVPLTIHLHLDETNPIHEIITVANNLGDIPPNTALMVITAGKKRFEVSITSDEQNNAKVILEYRAKNSPKVKRE